MSATWALDKPSNHAFRLDRSAFNRRSACLADVHSDQFFVRILAHVIVLTTSKLELTESAQRSKGDRSRSARLLPGHQFVQSSDTTSSPGTRSVLLKATLSTCRSALRVSTPYFGREPRVNRLIRIGMYLEVRAMMVGIVTVRISDVGGHKLDHL